MCVNLYDNMNTVDVRKKYIIIPKYSLTMYVSDRSKITESVSWSLVVRIMFEKYIVKLLQMLPEWTIRLKQQINILLIISDNNINRRINHIFVYIKQKLLNKLHHFLDFALQVDEFTIYINKKRHNFWFLYTWWLMATVTKTFLL